MSLKGIIFDFNGTLFQDTPMHEAIWRDYSVYLRGYPLSAEEFLNMHGRPTSYFIEYLLGRPASEEELSYHSEKKEKLYRDRCLELGSGIALTSGAADLLDELLARGIPRTIATASIRANVDFYFDFFHLNQWFEFEKVVYDDGTFPGKPDPKIYLLAAQKLGLAPSECIVVEDARSGIEAARRAGIGCIVAIGPAETHGDLKAINGVSSVISDFSEFDRALLNR
jgi:HAD superfamily hydrolase (TIGR01509 family)